MFKIPFFLPLIYPKLIWSINTEEKIIYLTFDDGPIPEVTEFVLDTLNKFNAKATFFCIGENVRKHPDIFYKVIEEGHVIGNHTYNHLNGWKTADNDYVQNVQKCDDVLKEHGVTTNLFRPPYGRIKKKQINSLVADYRLIMWDILTKDYNPAVNEQTALRKCKSKSSPGSIVVFHDSIKAFPRMRYVLPNFLQYFKSLGYRFDTLSQIW